MRKSTRKKPKAKAAPPARAVGPSVGALRKLLLRQLRGGQAYVRFSEAVGDLPAAVRGQKPPGAAHTPWQVLEHLRIAQWDIMDFSRDPAHQSPAWPGGYWPDGDAPPDDDAWDRSVQAFERDLRAMEDLIEDPRRDLFAKINHPEAQAHHTLAREALVLAEHNGYHIAELVMLRRLLGAWKRG